MKNRDHALIRLNASGNLDTPGEPLAVVSQPRWLSWVSRTGAALLLSGLAGCGEQAAPEPSQEELMQGIVTSQAPDTPDSLAAKKAKLEDNLKLARQAREAGELDRAIELLEESLSYDPKHKEVLLLLIKSSQERAKSVLKEDAWRAYRLIVQAGGYMRILRDAHPDLNADEQKLMADVLFEEACAHARSNRREEFSSSLSAALSAGFSDLERLNSSPDLDAFRKIPEMQALLKAAAESITRKAGS